MEKILVVYYKINYSSILRSRNFTFRFLFEKTIRYPEILYTIMSIVTLFITCKKLEVAQVSINKRMNFFKKLWHVPTLGHHSVIKSNVLMVHMTTWVNVKNIPRERNKTLKSTYFMILSACISRSGKTDVCKIR